MAPPWTTSYGATPTPEGGAVFSLWAPRAARVELCLLGAEPDAARRELLLERNALGEARVAVDEVPVGTRYAFRIDGDRELPDPASRFQPDGVHGPSQLVDLNFGWRDAAWRGLALQDYVIYELHVGTFTPEGTFDAARAELDRLVTLGITAVELMPVAQFPGARNWGYDGVLPYAVQASYGGPAGLQRFVDACHARGLAVILDVVYNHLGPEGNYLHAYGPYFTDTYHTPWGAALNFDGAGSDVVRRYFIDNAVYWVECFHVDALRLDAVHAIYDRSAYPILEEIGDAVHAAGQRLGRQVHVIAESDLNDPRLVRSVEVGGQGLDAVWNDDFHHALHALLTGERDGYYADYGGVEQLARAWQRAFVFTGQRSAFRDRRHGRAADDVPRPRFVVCAQNHDQVGNRMLGERLAALVDHDALAIAAGVVLCSPFTPLLFMGEEYGERAPFLYFTSHGDPQLIEAVRRGRRAEFAAFAWKGEAPDPQAESTFAAAKLDATQRSRPEHARLTRWYQALITQRAALPRSPVTAVAEPAAQLLWVVQGEGAEAHVIVAAFAEVGRRCTIPLPSEGAFRKALDSRDGPWGGGGSAWPEEVEGATGLEWSGGRGFVVYRKLSRERHT